MGVQKEFGFVTQETKCNLLDIKETRWDYWKVSAEENSWSKRRKQ